MVKTTTYILEVEKKVKPKKEFILVEQVEGKDIMVLNSDKEFICKVVRFGKTYFKFKNV